MLFRRDKVQTADTESFERKPVERVAASPDMGLTMDQVRTYRENGWDNRPVEAPSKSVRQIIKTNVCTYFNLVFAIVSVLLILVGAFGDLVFLPIIIANTLIGIIQELNAKRVLDKLTVLHAPRTQVIRNGITNPVSSEMLVLDDIVIFGPGDQICADAIVVEGEVSVNESLLTGETDEIVKTNGDFLLSGSFIVSGKCKARLERVGADSYISKLTLEAKAAKEGEQSEMIRSLDRLVKAIGIIIIPIGFILFVQQYIYAGATIKSSIQSMVAATLGMIPEGLYLLSSVTLAVSAVKLAFSQVLVHDMKCIETLARVNVLCVDKTGTITGNDMAVNDVITLDGFYESINEPLDELLGDFASAMSDDNITMKAMKKHFANTSGRKAGRISSFSSEHKYSGAVFGGKAYVLGAPEFVLREQYEGFRHQIEDLIGNGCRVLVFGLYDGEPDGNALTEGFTPFALITLSNPVRKDAKQTFRFFAEQGVGIKVISGDNPLTVSRVAKEAGIENADDFVDASTLESPEDIYRAVKEYTVFGRVTPSQKLAFIKALKAQGNTVAMTGDGVNDVLALKEADCSVAMASGSDAAAQASQLVLLESDFARMPEVVAEGRQVVNNLERSGSLFLVKNIFSLFMALISIIFSISYPLAPAQISLISTFTIGIPAFFLSQIPNTKLIKGRFLSNILLRAFPAGLTDTIIVSALIIFGQVFAVSSDDISVAATLLLAIVGFMILYSISRPMDWMKWLIFVISIGGLFVAMIFFPQVFAISGISLRCLMLLIIFSIVTEPCLRYLSLIVKKLRNRYLKKHNRESEFIS